MTIPIKGRSGSGRGIAAVLMALGFGAALLASTPAEARVFIGFGFGFPIGFPYYYPPYPYFDFGHLGSITRILGDEADGGKPAGLCQEMTLCCVCPLASPL